MKKVSLSRAARSLAEYATGGGVVVLTAGNKPVAALVSLKNMDPEAFVLSTNPVFGRIIGRARRDARTGKTVSLAAIERRFGSRSARARALPQRPRNSRSK